ncbi:MAG: nuclear transport factor 2 family protein [Polyangiales bacterium]
MNHDEIVKDFFAAFARRDHAGMVRHYAANAQFQDPVFGQLVGDEIGKMWKMLCTRGEDLKIDLVGVQTDGEKGSADWEARYTFKKTGRFVLNRVHSEFTFKAGQITNQLDTFDFWKWSTQALGIAGRALGWTPIIKNAVRKEAKQSLQSYA